MKAFEYHWSLLSQNFSYPDDMRQILAYLDARGNIRVTPKMIEKLYYEYSDEHAASWLIVDDERLQDFADWLSEYEL